ncbi:MAG: adenosine deaminase [Eubacteriales bacterium]|nr:adenosine deaminase [Eubacteriales bacterium]
MINKNTQKLPGIDLHCHLDGSLSVQCVSRLLGREVAGEELWAKEDCKSLAEYLEKFDLPLQCLQTEEGLRAASEDFLCSLTEDGMQYVEVRFAPLLSQERGLSVRQILQAVLEGLENGRKKCGIDYNVIVCAMRHHTQEENLSMLRQAREFLGQGVCAADLAGNEAAYPMHLFCELFAQARKLGFPFTIHAGECKSVENVREAILCKAARIGHGIALKGHTDIQRLCREHGVGIEMCPVSNFQTKAVEPGEEYPLREFLREGLLASVNTDNRTVSCTTLERERDFLRRNHGISEEELVLCTRNAIQTSFADDAIKQKLWKLLEQA